MADDLSVSGHPTDPEDHNYIVCLSYLVENPNVAENANSDSESDGMLPDEGNVITKERNDVVKAILHYFNCSCNYNHKKSRLNFHFMDTLVVLMKLKVNCILVLAIFFPTPYKTTNIHYFRETFTRPNHAGIKLTGRSASH